MRGGGGREALTVQAFLKGEPRLKVYFDQAYGYAVFPTVDKAGLFFGDKKAFEDFKKGKVKFAAGATAYAIKEGAAAVANYDNGVAVFVKGKGGLMADASIGGQSFSFVPTPRK